MLEHVIISKTLFIDIETVPCVADISDLTEYEQELWKEKRGRHKPDDMDEDEYFFNHAGILAEFGKIICISMGIFVESGGERYFRVKSVYGHDERKLLKEFLSIFRRTEQNFGDKMMICGHNIREFDIPYICRRLLINGMIEEFPSFFSRLQNAKPWELTGMVLDTLDTWRFGDYKNYISMKLLAHVMGIPSPKGDISGADVGRVYYHEGDLERIRKYCQHDVMAVAGVVLKLKGLPELRPDEVMES